MDLPLQAQPPPSLAQHCNSLIGVSRRISAHRDPQELFQNLPAELRQIVQFDGLAIVLHEEITNAISLRILDLSGHRAAGLQSPMADQEAMLGWIQQQVEPLVVRLPDQQSLIPWLDFPKDLGIRTVCALPLNTIHHRLGSLILASSDAFAYSAERVHLLSLLADRTALAVDDALAHEASRAAQAELQSKNERLKLLLDLNNAVVSNLQLRDLLRAIASSVRQVMKCDSVGVALPDPDDQRLRIHAVDFPEGKGLIREESKVPSADGPTSRAFRHCETIALDAHALSGLDAGDLAVAEGFRALCDIPLVSRNRSLGVLCLGRLHDSPFTGDEVEFLRQVAAQVAIAVENALAYHQIADLKDKMAQEKLYLEDEIRSQMNFDSIVGNSAALQKVLRQVETVAPTDSTVLIYGETGVGKELVARAIHNLSSRSRNAFVKLNCAAIPTGLLESEMFGHEKGAFTGAIAQRIGRFELANQGSVFLDEVGEIALELQPNSTVS